MKMAVASCAKIQDINPQPAWNEIVQERVDVLLLLGDTVYLQHDRHDDPAELSRDLDHLYIQQFAEPGFAALVGDVKARGGQVIAIYDDHDFLGNNRYGGDHGSALREAARRSFVSAFSPKMTGSDVYSFRQIGPVDLIVLDERFYRKSPVATLDDRDAILGNAQWTWFESRVQASTAPYLVVASSTTVHTFADESWEQYPAAFQRLVRLLRHRKGTLVVSGDVHRNAVYDDSGVVEIVTSAIARRGIVFGAIRKNYAILDFGANSVNVDLRSLKVGWRFKFDIPLNDWKLP